MFFGAIEITTDNDAITVDGNGGTLTPGDYYIYAPTAAVSFLDHLVSVMSTLASPKTIAFSISATGKVTLSCASAFTVTGWESYAFAGYAADALSSGTSHEADRFLPYCWFPGIGPSDSLAPTSQQGIPVEMVSQAYAPGGTVYTSNFGETIKQVLSFQSLTKARAWNENSSDNRSFQEWWQSTLGAGRELLYVPGYLDGDETVDHAYVAELGQEPKPQIKRQFPGSDAYWTTKIPLIGVDELS